MPEVPYEGEDIAGSQVALSKQDAVQVPAVRSHLHTGGCLKPVILMSGDPDWYRDVIYEHGERVISPRSMRQMPNRYRCDFGHLGFERSGLSDDASLLIVQYDMFRQFVPVNLSCFKCPKVLIVGDTHHGSEHPILWPIEYALQEKFDAVILEFTPRHVPLFRAAGLNAHWIPCFSLSPFERPVSERFRGVSFVGNVGCHPKRRKMLEYVHRTVGELQVHGGVSRQHAADIYSQSDISLNCSLNGDFNLRNLEVAAAGGYLLTDRVEGFSEAFDGLDTSQYTYGSLDELGDTINGFNPEVGKDLAEDMHTIYLARHTPAHKIADLASILQGGKPWELGSIHITDWRSAVHAEEIRQAERLLVE